MRTVGNYRLKSLIGRGGSSEVFAAEHAILGDLVAVKLVRPELADDTTHADALVDEGIKLRAVDHPNVVRVLDAGIDPDTHGCYLVMEYVDGETLSTRLRRGPLSEPDVRRIGAELADGVAAAHARGIVHRDLKPANVMLDGDRPKIVDFGIAKHLGTRSAVTTGRVIGTLAYMAPEQLASGLIAPSTDIWALGVILFEAATGRMPFASFDDGRCAQLVEEPARASTIVPTLSPALETILARCLSRDPALRPSASELAGLLRAEIAVDDERITVDAGPIAPLPPAALASSAASPLANAAAPSPFANVAPSRKAWLVVAVIIAAVVGAGAIVIAIWSSPDPEPPSSEPPPVTAAPPVAEPVTPPVAEPPPAIDVQPPPAAEPAPPAVPVRRSTKTKRKPPQRRETLD